MTTVQTVLDTADAPLGDVELESLIRRVYVDEGFTDPEAAKRAFTAAALRQRGRILFIRDSVDGALAGSVIAVRPGSPACRVARDGEGEMQLLAVSARRRNAGVGAALVAAALRVVRDENASKMVLRTQPMMHAAQRLYARAGFVRAPERDMQDGGRTFLVYERSL